MLLVVHDVVQNRIVEPAMLTPYRCSSKCNTGPRPATALQANTAGDTGLVTDLSVQGSAVLASSYMTSVTVLTLQQQSDKLCLKAVSACTDPCSGSDASPDVAAAHGAVKDDSAAFPVQAAVLVDDALVLAGMYPERLLLLRRDKAEEMAVLNARHSRLLTPTSGTCHDTLYIWLRKEASLLGSTVQALLDNTACKVLRRHNCLLSAKHAQHNPATSASVLL